MAVLNDAPLVSIVMPVYGTEAYVGRAIQCVRLQTYDNWELIIVDDCTPDASADIAREAAASDERIRIISHKSNRGLASARNTGIAAAHGEFLWMPDSDDFYDADLLERAVEGALSVEGGADLVMFGLVEEYFDARGKHLYDHDLPLDEGVFATSESWHPLVMGWENSTHLGYAWNKLWRTDRIRSLNLRYETVKLIEDVLFTAEYLKDARSVVVISGMPYHYAKRRGFSLTGANAFSAKEYWELLERRVRTLKDLLEDWGAFDDDARSTLGGLYCRFVVSALERTFFSGESWTHADRVSWLAEMREGDLFKALVPYARSTSMPVKMAVSALQAKSDLGILAIARMTYFAHNHSYTLFTRLRSGR